MVDTASNGGACLAVHEPAPATRVATAGDSTSPIAPRAAPPATLPTAPPPDLSKRDDATPPVGSLPAPPEKIVVEFDFESPPKTRHRLTPTFSFGAKFESDFEYESDFDLDSDAADDRLTGGPTLSLALSYEPSPYLRAFVEAKLERKFLLDGPRSESSDPVELNVSRANVTFPHLADGLALQIGRQRLKDEREWYYDEKLDAVRLFYRIDSLGFELSASRERLFDRDLLNDDGKRAISNYFFVGRYAWAEDSMLEAFVLARDDRTHRSRDPVFFGLRSTGEAFRNLDYWIDLAHVRGSDRSEDIRGYGIDAGATYVFDAPFEPSLTLDAAFGSGDSDDDDGVDRAFRQTGLQDNSAKFNGVTRFKYYGEVFDPELSNMTILTAGVGVRPSKRSSIDVVYHYYQQHRAAASLRDAAVDISPQGRSRDLGHEVDLVVGYREIRDFDIEIVFGAFLPGDAFADGSDNAYFGGLEFSYNF
ncbi:MAG: alginate export family protein [Alphaproteobacteria bacterium]